VIGRRAVLGGLLGLPLLVACKRTTEPAALAAGDPMPGFGLPTARAGEHAVRAGTGPFLLNFWATWCPPCRAEMAALDRVHRGLAARGLAVLGISVDEDVFLVEEFALQEKLTLPLLLDRGGALARSAFRVAGYPSSFLVDRRGVIVAVWVGERDWDSAPIRARLEQLLR